MALSAKQWPFLTGKDPESVSRWGQELIRRFQMGWHRDFALGTVTLSAGTTTMLADKNLLATSKIFFTAANSQAAALGVPWPSIKAAASFTLRHAAAAGTEKFDYVALAIPAA